MPSLGRARVIGGTVVLIGRKLGWARHAHGSDAIRAASSDCCSERGGDALPEPAWARIFGMSFCSFSQCSQARATTVTGGLVEGLSGLQLNACQLRRIPAGARGAVKAGGFA